MFLPFYSNTDFQEFRKFISNQDILRQVKYLCKNNEIPKFVLSSKYPFYKAYFYYVDDKGETIEKADIDAKHLESVNINGQYQIQVADELLDSEHLYCKFYIVIDTSVRGAFVSEIITVINEVQPAGRILLSTGRFLLLNSGGNILLNDYTAGQVIEEAFTKITATSSRNFNDYSLANKELDFYCHGRPYLVDHYEQSVSEVVAGIETVFEKVIMDVYSLKFFAVGTVAAGLSNLAFFDNVEIETPEGQKFNIENPVTVDYERVNDSGIYEVEITFNTEYRIDIQTNTTEEEDEMLEMLIGIVQHIPAKGITISSLLDVLNAKIVNTDFQYIECNGASYPDANLYPKAKLILGVNGSALAVPDLRGRVLIGAGQSVVDKNGDSVNLTSSLLSSDGEYKHVLTASEIDHEHLTTSGVTGGAGQGIAVVDSPTMDSPNSHNNIQPSLAAYAIMLIDKPLS